METSFSRFLERVVSHFRLNIISEIIFSCCIKMIFLIFNKYSVPQILIQVWWQKLYLIWFFLIFHENLLNKWWLTIHHSIACWHFNPYFTSQFIHTQFDVYDIFQIVKNFLNPTILHTYIKTLTLIFLSKIQGTR
jgi:hypothetical protein